MKKHEERFKFTLDPISFRKGQRWAVTFLETRLKNHPYDTKEDTVRAIKQALSETPITDLIKAGNE